MPRQDNGSRRQSVQRNFSRVAPKLSKTGLRPKTPGLAADIEALRAAGLPES